MTSLKEGQKQACKSGQQRLLQLMDMRYPSHTGIRSAVTADVESLAWDPNDQNSFVVSLQDGTVQGFDVRGAASNPDSGCKPCFTLHAHDEAVTTVSFNTSAPKLLATGSIDKMVKLWDLSNSQPSCVASNNPKAWVDVDVARQWVEKQGLLPSSEELPLTESFPGRGGLLAAAREARYDKEAVMKFFHMLIRRRYFSDEMHSSNPWSNTPAPKPVHGSGEILSDDDHHFYKTPSFIGDPYKYNALPPLPAQRNLTPPPTLYPQQPVSVSENYSLPRFALSGSPEIGNRSKRTDINV